MNRFEEAVPYLAATHSVDRFIDSVVAHGRLEDAFVVSKAACDGRFCGHDLKRPPPAAAGGAAAAHESRLSNVSRLLSQRHSEFGQPILAAACRLAVSDSHAAVRQLYIGNELTLAAALALSMEVTVWMTEICEELALNLEARARCALFFFRWQTAAPQGKAGFLAPKQCLSATIPDPRQLGMSPQGKAGFLVLKHCLSPSAQASGHWHQAMAVLSKIPSRERAQEARGLCAARFPASAGDVDDFYAAAGFESPGAYAGKAAAAAGKTLPVPDGRDGV